MTRRFLVMRNKLTCHIGAGIGAQSDARSRRAASGGEDPLAEGSGGRMPRYPSGRGSGFAGSGVRGNDRSFERVCQTGTETMLIRALIVQILVELCCQAAFDGSADGITGEAGAKTLTKTGNAATVVFGMIAGLSDGGTDCHTPESAFAHDRFFPMLPVRMRAVRRRTKRSAGNANDRRDEMKDSHIEDRAIGKPPC